MRLDNAERHDGAQTYEQAVSEARDSAADFILSQLATALGLDSFEPCDGTETWEGDVAGTVYSILRAARVLDDENEVAQHPAKAST